MHQIIQWLKDHKIANIVILIIYYIVVVLPHKKFGTFLNKHLQNGITRDQYNLYVIIGATVILLVYFLPFFKNTMKLPDRNRLWLYLGFNILLAILVINILFVINIEVIHFPQYAMCALIIFPLVGNYTATLIWTTMAGMLDEAYQYFYLAPKDTSFYDLNDVITNLIGAVFGLLLIRSFRVVEWNKFSLFKSTIWIGLISIFLTIVVTHLTGILSIYPSDDRPFHLLRKWPPGFWSTVPPNVTYHVTRPVEGMLLTIGLWTIFSGIGKMESLESEMAS